MPSPRPRGPGWRPSRAAPPASAALRTSAAAPRPSGTGTSASAGQSNPHPARQQQRSTTPSGNGVGTMVPAGEPRLRAGATVWMKFTFSGDISPSSREGSGSMRGIARYTPLIALVPVITACHIVPQFSASSSSSATPPTSGASTSGGGSTPSTPSSPATTSPPNTGPLGVLPMPAGAKPWDDNKSTPMGLDAFIKAFYVDSAFTKEKALYTQRGFVSGTIQGWINADGSQQSIAIIKFKGSSGAV